MKIALKTCIAVALLLTFGKVEAQRFLEPSFTFASDKVAYITLTDGTEKEVFVTSIKRTKGLIEELKVKDKSGAKSKLAPAQIKHMYLPQSGWDKFAKDMDKTFDTQKWDNGELDQNRFKEGYIYFEQAEVQLKKEKKVLMMQLLNPSFSSKVKVYHDPYADETASVGIGGFTVMGGDEKSYYVSVRGGTAVKLEKKNYKEDFRKIFGFCTPLEQKFKEVKWADFNEHVVEHNTSCE